MNLLFIYPTTSFPVWHNQSCVVVFTDTFQHEPDHHFSVPVSLHGAVLACRKPIVQIKRLLKLSTGNIHYFPDDFETSVLLPVSDDDSAARYVNGCDSRPGCVCWQTETLLCRLKDAHCLILHRLSIFKAWGGRPEGKWSILRCIQMANNTNWGGKKIIWISLSWWKVTLCFDPDR